MKSDSFDSFILEPMERKSNKIINKINSNNINHSQTNQSNSHQKIYQITEENIDKKEKIESRESDYQEFLANRIVEVQKPELIKEGILTSYKLYRIKTRKNNTQYWDTIVNRRFNDFQFLHHKIIENYGGYVIPKLPQKNFLANLNLQSQVFVDIRTKDLQKYLEGLLKHGKVQLSKELQHFLFDQEFNFSFSKGQFSGQSSTLDGIKSITSSVVDLTKQVYQRILGKKQRRFEFSRDSQEQTQLKIFQRQVEDLIKVTQQISAIVSSSYQEFAIIHQLSIVSSNPHLATLTAQRDYISCYKQLIDQFQTISSFILNCSDAIARTKALRAQIENLQEQKAAIQAKERENPRNRELDVIRAKIQKANAKSQKWIGSLKKELLIYTSEGRTLMGQFVEKFIQLKAEIYTAAANQ